MKSPSNTFPRPLASRESELARNESEMGALETRLADQVSRATSEASALSTRLTQVRAELARVQSEHSEDVSLPEIGARLQAAAIPELAVESAREKALEARQKALEARRLANQDMQIALHAFQQQTAALTRELSEAETTLKEVVEAAARARREAEAARARQAQQARAEATRSHAPPARTVTPPPRPAAPGGRARERVHLRASIHLSSDSNFFTGFSPDIHTGGIFVATVETVPRGTTVDLDFTLPGGRPMKASGVVRWLREPNDRTPDLMPGVGVQFQELAPEVASAISAFVARREPLFYPD